MATGFDIYEEDYDDLRDYEDPNDLRKHRFIKRLTELGVTEEDYDDPMDYYDWLDLQYFREFGDD